MTMLEIRQLTGLSQRAFAETYGIPKRTIECWETGDRTPPHYLLPLLEHAVRTGFIPKASEDK